MRITWHLPLQLLLLAMMTTTTTMMTLCRQHLHKRFLTSSIRPDLTTVTLTHWSPQFASEMVRRSVCTQHCPFLPCNCESIRTVLLSTTVCPSVRLSVKCVNCDKTRETSTHTFIPCERKIHLVFRHEEWLVGDVPYYLKFWVKLTPPPLQENRFPIQYSLVAPQPLQLAKSAIMTNRKLSMGFPMSLRWTA